MADSPDAPRQTSLPVYLAGAILLAILLFGVYATATNPHLLEHPDEASIIRGEWASRYQAAFEEGLLIREPATSLWSLFRYLVFREGREGVLIGTDGWLFTSEELEYYPDEAAQTERWLDYAAEVRDRLAERDIGLVVALVPAKARIYEANLGRYRLPGYVRPRYERFRLGLSERGIAAPDLVDALSPADSGGEQTFLRTDTHWTPAGALAAADALSGSIASVLETKNASRTRFVRDAGESVVHRGDLLTFLPLGPFAERFGPEPDRVREVSTSRADDREAGLFDDVSIPVTLVGTSYSAGELWDFAGAIRATADADVLNVATQGEGPFVPMRDYLELGEIEETQPVLVVWEIPERYVPVSYPVGDS